MDWQLDRIRRPSYTGDNRCWPCTLLNSVLLALLAGVLYYRGRRRSAVAVGAGGLAAIGLRGYLFPYTPQIAPKLTAALPVDVFDHETNPAPAGSLAETVDSSSSSTPTAKTPTADDNEEPTTADDNGEPTTTVDDADEKPATAGDGGPTEDATDTSSAGLASVSSEPGDVILESLLEAGVVTLDGADEAGTVELDSEFRDEWHTEMEALRSHTLDSLAEIAASLTPPAVETRVHQSWGEPVVVLQRPDSSPVTLEKGIAVAELAAARVLAGRVDEQTAQAAGRPLRSLLEACPLCGDELTISQSSCCGEITRLGKTPDEKLICPSCDVRFFTFTEA